MRWSCTDEPGKTADQFFEHHKIRLFAEFECMVPVQEASAGLGIRDSTGQMIHARHLYQIRPETKIAQTHRFPCWPLRKTGTKSRSSPISTVVRRARTTALLLSSRLLETSWIGRTTRNYAAFFI